MFHSNSVIPAATIPATPATPMRIQAVLEIRIWGATFWPAALVWKLISGEKFAQRAAVNFVGQSPRDQRPPTDAPRKRALACRRKTSLLYSQCRAQTGPERLRYRV